MMLRKAVWMLRGKLAQSVLQILLMVVIASTLLTGIIFKETGEFITSGGTFYYSVQVIPKDRTGGIAADTIEKLADTPDVAGYNSSFMQKAEPINFENWVEYYGDSGTLQDSHAMLSINLDMNFADIFLSSEAELTAGSFPTKDQHGAVIEQSMSKHNGIHIGDSIQLNIIDNGVPGLMDLKVLGIYQLNVPLQVEDDSKGETTYAVSPYTRIYTDFDTVKTVHPDLVVPCVDFFTLHKESVPPILDAFKAQLGDDLEVFDSTNSIFVILNQSVKSMMAYYNWMLYALILTSLLMFILFTVYTQHKNIYETAVLSILGQSRKEILRQNILNASVLAAISSAGFSLLAAVFADRIGLFWISAATRNYQVGVCNFSFTAEQAALVNNFSVADLALKILAIAAVIFVISIFIALIYSILVLRLSARKRMDKVS